MTGPINVTMQKQKISIKFQLLKRKTVEELKESKEISRKMKL